MRISTKPLTTIIGRDPSEPRLPSSKPTDLYMQDLLSPLVSTIVKPPDAKEPLRVLLADDHEMLRLGTATFLKLELGCEICAETADGREALKLAESTRPNVAVIDLGLPGLNGLDLTKQMRRFLPDTEVVILSGDISADLTQRALAAGAKAFILKLDAIAHLAEAVQMAGEHRYYLTPRAHESMHFEKASKPSRQKIGATQNLTPREREALQLLAEGKSNKEVASVLHISVKTVETHRATVMRKLQLARLSDLVRYAIRNKIIHA
jgi:DNA-binding NarL/FixJ family response regulator